MNLTSLIGSLCNKDVKGIGFFGLGKSNLKIAEILRDEGWSSGFTYRAHTTSGVSISDIKHVCVGENSLSDLREDVLFLSPSVRRTGELVDGAEKAKTVLCSDAELFFHSLPKNVFAITGSDGKSTVTYLTSRLTEKLLRAPPAGNFGLPLCSLLKSDTYAGYVVELSSFQLNYMKPKTERALITNISENHLNWHDGMAEYVLAKKNLLANASVRALALDGDICRKTADECKVDILISDTDSATELYRKYKPSLVLTRERGHICVNGTPYLTDEALLRSESYNVRNFMCALALSYGYSDRDSALELARSFRGLPHRKESFLIRDGIEYVNSSIDSTPARTAATLSTLSSPAIVIVGGASKGLSYAPLIDSLRAHAKAVILTGESTRSLFDVLSEFTDFSGRVYADEDFDGAVRLAARLAERGDTVILSPAHTSYDRFDNFESRGDRFKRIIEEFTK